MKRWMSILATLIFAVCLSASAKDNKKNVERGMSQQEVINILGEPKLRRFDEYGDKWEFYKTSIIADDKYIVVRFDRTGKVVSYNSRFIEPIANNAGCRPQRPTPPAYEEVPLPIEPMYPVYCLDDASFSKLYNKVKKASFDDTKFDLLEVASLGCYYSCAQTVRMMKMFSFGDEQLKVLRMMAPRIIDPQNATDIYKVFSFDSEKEKAGEIMRRSR